tara:strand:+ start:442 stop:576 length:135 start_codon:yes stop_codon:yes gene_type:complete
MKNSKQKIKSDSNIAKILSGKTKGYNNWYVKYILDNKNIFLIIK